ncbi:MAG: pantoate--beta-alanine ligase [Kordiimonas sp.]|nr:pantoate--beta-alanine ligase [Kordiimonas sp.]
MTKILRTVAELRQQVHAWKADGLKVAMVPTMGALHHAHMSLVTHARTIGHADRIVVTIFVNPTQFGPNEDFDKYPRQEQQDVALLKEHKVDILYAPAVSEMYPPGFATTVQVSGLTSALCGASRPGHFDGVSTVVTKLLLQGLPDCAVFGEKDYQQLAVIRQSARDLDIPVDILGAPLIRDADGLATSSRNVYLSESERQTALLIPRTLQHITTTLEQGPNALCENVIAKARRTLQEGGIHNIHYLDIRDAQTLENITRVHNPARVFIAAQVGTTRLIDNMAINPASV